jgi:hypothetical protein
MPLRIRYQYPTGSSLGYSIERLTDGTFYDFSSSTFSSSPTILIAALPEDTGSFLGRYKVTLGSTPAAQFTNGDYAITIHNLASANSVVGELAVVMANGNDGTVIPNSSTGGADPWATFLPGSYPSGSAGAILGNNLDAKVSSRSTYAGGVVASVAAPVTVGANNDKTGYSVSSVQDKAGYSLAAAGLDAIQVETGVNARQALSPILAASAGVLLGAGTGTIIIKGGNVAITRITATTDNAGNRTAVTLSIPS